MFFQCTFKNVKDQISVKNYALFKLQSKINKLTNNPIGLHLVVKQDKTNIFLDCKLDIGDKSSPIVIRNITGMNFFEAIDNLTTKIERSIIKKKTQKQSFRKNHNFKKKLLTNDSYSNDIDVSSSDEYDDFDWDSSASSPSYNEQDGEDEDLFNYSHWLS